MNYKIERILDENFGILEAKETEIGDLMEIVNSDILGYNGLILLHHYSGFVALDAPEKVWGKDCPLKVRLLSKSAIIKLVIE